MATPTIKAGHDPAFLWLSSSKFIAIELDFFRVDQVFKQLHVGGL